MGLREELKGADTFGGVGEIARQEGGQKKAPTLKREGALRSLPKYTKQLTAYSGCISVSGPS
ncbi:hypothetical protein SAMN04488032_10835 [Pacificibacter marinus]|uniref:Uncharacterized protein n=1 Tax=Pacificibacter marinus TaxID=658057 RepID=A0A1Y5S8Q1_9RHOB|nr:hypothetical protein SAMN04488032_10835 [Pacificibacter marinus]SLN32308.1 hypothetical protein PAM7971_01273 [Pacificibacter marinus]